MAHVTLKPDLAVYLGDAVYLQPSDWEANAFWLLTYNGIETLDQIYLEDAVIRSLLQHLPQAQRLLDRARKAEDDASRLRFPDTTGR